MLMLHIQEDWILLEGERCVIFFPLFLFLLVFFVAGELASLETQFRLVQTARPRGVGRDEGPASLPVLITKRQGACRQINGKGLGTNTGHAWWWDFAWCVCVCVFMFQRVHVFMCVILPLHLCVCVCVCKFNDLCYNTKLKKKTLVSNDCWIARRWSNLKTSGELRWYLPWGHTIARKPFNYAAISSDPSVNPFSLVLMPLPL